MIPEQAPAYVKLFALCAPSDAIYKSQRVTDASTGQRIEEWLYMAGDDVAWTLIGDYTRSEWATAQWSQKIMREHGLSISLHVGQPSGCSYFQGDRLIAYALGKTIVEAQRKAILRLASFLYRQKKM